MQAIVHDRYGPPERVLRLREIDEPTPGEDEVLIRAHAAAVAADDWHLIRGLPYVARLETGLLHPRHRIPGREVAGRVKWVGEA